MFCPKCGTQNPDGSKFCGSCGAPFSQPAAAHAATRPPAAPMAAQTPAAHSATQPSAPRPKRKGVKVLIAVGAVAVLAVGALAYGKVEGSRRADASKSQIAAEFVNQYGPGSGFEGFASTQYVGSSSYEVGNRSVTSADGFFSHVSGTMEAELSNTYFKSSVTLDYTATVDADGKVSDAEFTVKDHANTPLRGITNDSEHGISATDTEDLQLNEDGVSCSVEAVVDDGEGPTWFQHAGHKEKYTYTFDGEQWNFDSAEEGEEITIFSPPYGSTFQTASGELSITFVKEGELDKDERWSGVGYMDTELELYVQLDNVPLENKNKVVYDSVKGGHRADDYVLTDLGNGALGLEVTELDSAAPGRGDSDNGFHFLLVFNQNTANGLDIYRCSSGGYPVHVRSLKDGFEYWPAKTELSSSGVISDFDEICAAKATPDLTLVS